MSETIVPPVEERQTVHRDFPVELAEGDGRTIEAMIVPYNTPAMVADPPDFKAYREEWLPGVFDKQMTSPGRVKVLLNFEHEKGLRGVIGHGLELRDSANGPVGVFRVHDNSDGDKALELVREGLLTGMSLEAVPIRSVKTAAGVMQRVRAHLDSVALCRFPAFEQAQVMAVREEPVAVARTEIVPPINEALEARLAALGVVPLSRVAVTKKPWDGAASRFTDEEYQRSCLIDRGGDAPVKERCSLPVLEPDGTLNVNALAAAASRMSQVVATASEKAAAARKLVRYYNAAGMEPPASMTMMARR